MWTWWSDVTSPVVVVIVFMLRVLRAFRVLPTFVPILIGHCGITSGQTVWLGNNFIPESGRCQVVLPCVFQWKTGGAILNS